MLAKLSVNIQPELVFLLYLLTSYIENYTKTFLLALYKIPTLPFQFKTFFHGGSGSIVEMTKDRSCQKYLTSLLFWALRKKLDIFFLKIKLF